MSLSSLIAKIERKSLLASAVLIVGMVGAMAFFWLFSRGVEPSATTEIQFELRGVGRIPNMTYAMAGNRDLRDRVEMLCAQNEAYVFGQINAVDKEIVEILLLWSGVDLDEPVTQNTREDIHPHVDHFIRAAYNMRDTSPIKNNPLVGEDPWIRWFGQYKSRLIAQCAAGRQVYDGKVTYNIDRDRVIVDGELSADFINGFAEFLQTKDDKKLYTNNLLAFINDTKGLKNLSDTERELIDVLRKNAS
ncbi:MAG: hypothetical protein AAF569_03805 [Pseudomonadota bacterium]